MIRELSASLIHPRRPTLVNASSYWPIGVRVSNDTLNYGSTAANLDSTLAAGQQILFRRAFYIQTADGAVLLSTYGAGQPEAVQGIEVGYAETTDTHTQTGVGSSDVPGLSVTVATDLRQRPYRVILDTYGVANSSASGVTLVEIAEDATPLAYGLVSATQAGVSVHREARIETPTPGMHTYKAVLTQASTGNSTLTSAATSPSFLQVVEV